MGTKNIFERIRENISEMTGSAQEDQRLIELVNQMENKQVNLLIAVQQEAEKAAQSTHYLI